MTPAWIWRPSVTPLTEMLRAIVAGSPLTHVPFVMYAPVNWICEPASMLAGLSSRLPLTGQLSVRSNSPVDALTAGVPPYEPPAKS